MRFEFAPQYSTACVVVEDGDKAHEIMNHPDIADCYYDPANLCVRFPGRPQELYTVDAFHGSMEFLCRDRLTPSPEESDPPI